jgi:hypothetical protein
MKPERESSCAGARRILAVLRARAAARKQMRVADCVDLVLRRCKAWRRGVSRGHRGVRCELMQTDERIDARSIRSLPAEDLMIDAARAAWPVLQLLHTRERASVSASAYFHVPPRPFAIVR